MKSPRRQETHCPQCPPCQPTPTRWPFFQIVTPGPTASITPATSCPVTRGYCSPGQWPSFTKASLWQTPQACILMRTVLGPGSGTARFTTSNTPPGPLTCTAVICDMIGLLDWIAELRKRSEEHTSELQS